eukprot:1474899-Amphidinium_carterae.2
MHAPSVMKLAPHKHATKRPSFESIDLISFGKICALWYVNVTVATCTGLQAADSKPTSGGVQQQPSSATWAAWIRTFAPTA